MKTCPSEHEEQVMLFEWWAMWAPMHGIDERLMFAIPNGASKSMSQAVKFKREGLKSGVPDVMLALPRGGWHGLFIELKRQKGGVLSDTQKAYEQVLSSAGYAWTRCNGFDAARAAIVRYLGM